MVDEDHLRLFASEGRYTFIFTWVSTIEKINKTAAIFKQSSCLSEVVECISAYPIEDADSSLNFIAMFRDLYDCKVVYSVFDVGLEVSHSATALNTNCLKRHITLNRLMYGSDQYASIESMALCNLVFAASKIQQDMGNGQKRVLQAEIPVAKKLYMHHK